MDIIDLVSWLMVGLLVGSLAIVLGPARTLGGLLGIIGSGALGALLGGWGWALLFGIGPSMFQCSSAPRSSPSWARWPPCMCWGGSSAPSTAPSA